MNNSKVYFERNERRKGHKGDEIDRWKETDAEQEEFGFNFRAGSDPTSVTKDENAMK